ncbi:MAG: hypothetical protein PWQ34_449 [Caldanaerobacter sp.]|jgi:hypothetical protein|uniref:Uncharacterized protein n=2 Tax=Caldanaerobacter subterraneus TaxID=911092 RepID=U5CLT3_CALSX|nr:hypothetical protein O163_13075 [Caldanaerobacter subterraneus subsp. yonseiensis KB-1]KKC28895.1 hypothetical protein CDSM653_02119 [Caldanaerobacter subterraneus subsp. pacificus DSM 12653]MDI3518302.1 hypothetical protein [Caldanaerobacter sp.]
MEEFEGELIRETFYKNYDKIEMKTFKEVACQWN